MIWISMRKRPISVLFTDPAETPATLTLRHPSYLHPRAYGICPAYGTGFNTPFFDNTREERRISAVNALDDSVAFLDRLRGRIEVSVDGKVLKAFGHHSKPRYCKNLSLYC